MNSYFYNSILKSLPFTSKYQKSILQTLIGIILFGTILFNIKAPLPPRTHPFSDKFPKPYFNVVCIFLQDLCCDNRHHNLLLLNLFYFSFISTIYCFPHRQFLFDSRCRRVNNNLPPIKLTLQ